MISVSEKLETFKERFSKEISFAFYFKILLLLLFLFLFLLLCSVRGRLASRTPPSHYLRILAGAMRVFAIVLTGPGADLTSLLPLHLLVTLLAALPLLLATCGDGVFS